MAITASVTVSHATPSDASFSAKEGPEPITERVDIGELVTQVELWRMVREAAEAYAAREMEIDEDDEEVLLLV